MVKKVIVVLIVVVLLLYLVPLAYIIYNQNSKINNKVDYLIVLGAKVDEYGPTRTLQYRLDKAVEYYNEYPEVKIIVSGGKGIDEPKAEAEVMKDYLLTKGVLENNILLENKSTSTFENMEYSKKIIDEQSSEYSLGIVTTDFHIFRSKMIASRVFDSKCEFQSAKNYSGLAGIYSVLREPLALYKSFIFDKS